jgi:hypothetical protein
MKNDLSSIINKRPSHFDRLLVGKKNLIGAEVGVWKAEHAWAMLKQLDIKKLYLVDPYEIYEGYWGMGTQSPQEILMSQQFAKKLLKDEGFEKKVEWIYKYSPDGAKDIKDNSLDFIYIDGNHDYEYVLQDLMVWEPKLKKGGLMGGHDYIHEKVKPYHEGVIKGVNEYTEKNKIKFEVSGEEWYYWK